jgi:hypothetical protein
MKKSRRKYAAGGFYFLESNFSPFKKSEFEADSIKLATFWPWLSFAMLSSRPFR